MMFVILYVYHCIRKIRKQLEINEYILNVNIYPLKLISNPILRSHYNIKRKIQIHHRKSDLLGLSPVKLFILIFFIFCHVPCIILCMLFDVHKLTLHE